MEESYEKFLVKAVCHFNSDSVLVVEDDLHYINDHIDCSCWVFHCMFWVYYQSIDGFKHYRPILFVDGTFLYDKYNGYILCAIGLDGNNKIFPLVFAIVEEEDSENWGWCMSCLRVYVKEREDVCVISNCHIIIKKTMEQDWWLPLSEHYRYCTRYILSNYNIKFKNAGMKECLRKIGKQHWKSLILNY